jgi:hypothetical protein
MKLTKNIRREQLPMNRGGLPIASSLGQIERVQDDTSFSLSTPLLEE